LLSFEHGRRPPRTKGDDVRGALRVTILSDMITENSTAQPLRFEEYTASSGVPSSGAGTPVMAATAVRASSDCYSYG
jgi:hypothetical protein